MVNEWKKVNKDGVYVAMPVTVHKPARKAGTGHGPEQAKNSEDEDAKEDSRALTKVKFKKPMEELGRALEQCRKELAKNNQQNMLKHVLTKYNAIQEMVSHGKLFDSMAMEEEEDEEDISSQDEEEERIERKRGDDDDEDYSFSDTSDRSESEGEGSSGSEESGSDGDDVEKNDDDTKKSKAGEKVARAGDDDADDDNTGRATAGDVNADGPTECNNNSHGNTDDDERNNDQNSENVNDENERKNKQALTALYNYIAKHKGKVQKAVISGKEIAKALGLTETPDFRTSDKAYFCSLRSRDMQLIKKLMRRMTLRISKQKLLRKSGFQNW